MPSKEETLRILNSEPGGGNYTLEEAIQLKEFLTEFADFAFQEFNRQENDAGRESIREKGDFI